MCVFVYVFFFLFKHKFLLPHYQLHGCLIMHTITQSSRVPQLSRRPSSLLKSFVRDPAARHLRIFIFAVSHLKRSKFIQFIILFINFALNLLAVNIWSSKRLSRRQTSYKAVHRPFGWRNKGKLPLCIYIANSKTLLAARWQTLDRILTNCRRGRFALNLMRTLTYTL